MTLRYFYVFCFMLMQGVFFLNYTNAQQVACSVEKQYNDIKELTINGDFCSVKIKGSEAAVTTFKGVIKSDENPDQYKINSGVQDGVLSIQVVKPSSWKSHWGELDIEVPNGIVLNVKTHSGKVSISSLQKSTVEIESKSGYVTIDDANVTMHSVSPAGDITLRNVKGSIKASTKSGTVILSNGEGDFRLGSSKGNYLVKNVKGSLITDGGEGQQEIDKVEGDLNLKSSSGEIKVSLCNGNITTRSFNGSQKVFQTNGIYKLQSSTGTITGNRMTFKASSSFETTEGNIKIQVVPNQKLTYELSSENSFLRAMNKSKKKKLKIGKGDIIITGISTTGSQSYN